MSVENKFPMKTVAFSVFFLLLNANIFAQTDRLNFYLPGIRWGMTRTELSENRPIEIKVSGRQNNAGDAFFSENLDAQPIVKAEYGFGYPDSIGLLSVDLTCIDRASAKILAAEISGGDLENRSGIALKLEDGSGLYLTLTDDLVRLQWRPIFIRRTQK
jgi:hypothetical protein